MLCTRYRASRGSRDNADTEGAPQSIAVEKV